MRACGCGCDVANGLDARGWCSPCRWLQVVFAVEALHAAGSLFSSVTLRRVP